MGKRDTMDGFLRTQRASGPKSRRVTPGLRRESWFRAHRRAFATMQRHFRTRERRPH